MMGKLVIAMNLTIEALWKKWGGQIVIWCSYGNRGSANL